MVTRARDSSPARFENDLLRTGEGVLREFHDHAGALRKKIEGNGQIPQKPRADPPPLYEFVRCGAAEHLCGGESLAPSS